MTFANRNDRLPLNYFTRLRRKKKIPLDRRPLRWAFVMFALALVSGTFAAVGGIHLLFLATDDPPTPSCVIDLSGRAPVKEPSIPMEGGIALTAFSCGLSLFAGVVAIRFINQARQPRVELTPSADDWHPFARRASLD
jgi:hypothetical protein